MTNSDSQTNIVAIIQARQNSKRLFEKCFKELSGKAVLTHIIERAQAIEGISHVIVATGDAKKNQDIIKLTEDSGATTFAGSESNVLERYYMASQLFPCDYIIRITGDNPFTDVDYASMAVQHAIESSADLSSITNIPLGTAVELIKREALNKCYHNANHTHHLEHVTPYIKENPQLFTISRKPVYIYNNIPDLRLTIDTEEDFQLASELYSALYTEQSFFSLHQIFNYLRLYPEMVHINSAIKQRPMTHFENG
ncbi:MAG: hypothetical protein PF637_06355 [Spirochaetes bacterium]|jgi:spore coat polysaccharide biosynthesis protein SpsF|nr:hypothetical protein [Spirochaetota bacterium]